MKIRKIFRFGSKRHALSLLASLTLSISVISSRRILAQIIPKQPNPFSAQSSSSTGCSLQKSCAELAPAMIQSALGPSPLESNLRYLTSSVGGRMTGTVANEKAVAWATSAFRTAGITEVTTEGFALPIAWSEGDTTAKVISPKNFVLKLVSTGWSPPIHSGIRRCGAAR